MSNAVSALSKADAARLSKGRSALTNAATKLDGGIDGRSAAARRFSDLVRDFARGLGGIDTLDEADRAVIRQAAAATMRAEQLQAAIVRGETVDADEIGRLANTSRRLLSHLRGRGRQKPDTGDLHSYLSARGAPA